MSDRNSSYRRGTRVFPTQVGERPVESREAFETLRSQENFRRQIADQQLIGKPIAYSIVRSNIATNLFNNPAVVGLQQVVWNMDVESGSLFEIDKVAYCYDDPALDLSDDLYLRMELAPLGAAVGQHIAPNWFNQNDAALTGRRIRPSFGTPTDPTPVEPIVISGPVRVNLIVERSVVAFREFFTLIVVVYGRLVVPVGGR